MTVSKTHFINGLWLSGEGAKFNSTDPVTGEILWQGQEATLRETDHAVFAAREACEFWCGTPIEKRIAVLKGFQKCLDDSKADLAETISREVGKPLWESLTEVTAMINKVTISVGAYDTRTAATQKIVNGETSATRFKPHGVVAVFGPYNFPGHLANGHIVPSLLAGNTVVFKPSELAPLTAQKTIEVWEKSGAPRGVINLVQGGRGAGQSLANHPDLDGLFFTGSSSTGLALSKHFAEHPQKILALEMGGNNPLIVTRVGELKAAAYLTVLSSFLTAGQRCTCARRLVIMKDTEGDAFLHELIRLSASLKVDHYTANPEPFMGPMITPKAAQELLREQERLINSGAKSLLEMRLIKNGTALLSPGILDVTAAAGREDKEVFGPLLQVIRVNDFDEAIHEANNTAYGLAAGLFSHDKSLYEKFYAKIRAGIVNWNRQLTGASSTAPFGGTGLSGNHRPSAYFAADYCSYPVASIESDTLVMPKTIMPGIVL